jgi:hypothetical protein
VKEQEERYKDIESIKTGIFMVVSLIYKFRTI